MINANVVIDVFDSCIYCLSVLLNTEVGAWIGGCFVLLFIFSIFNHLKNI